MIRIFCVITLLFNLSYGCYSVSTSPLNDCHKKGKFIQNDIDAGEFEPGSIGNTFQVPIYIKSDSTKPIQIQMAPVKLSNDYVSLGDLNGVFQSNITGRSVTFTDNNKVEIIPSGYENSRDGITQVGFITFFIPDLESLQSRGEYGARLKIKVYEDGKKGKNTKIDFYFDVKSILVVGLENVSSEYGDKVFKGANIDFGTLSDSEETYVESDVYLKSNYEYYWVYLRFDDTPDLRHKFSGETIDLKYYYKRRYSYSYREIVSGRDFLIDFFSNNEGETPVGNMKFVAGKSEGKSAGEYKATVSVTVSVL